MPETEVRSNRINVDTLMRVLGAIAALGGLATGIVSFIKHPSGVALHVEATLENNNAPFATMVLTGITCFVSAFMLLIVLRVPALKTLHAFMVGYVSIGLGFILLGFMCFGIA